MGTYNRRAFLKHSAMLAAASAFSNPLLSHASSKTGLAPARNHYSNELLSGDSALREAGLNSIAMQQAPPRPFFANTNSIEVIAHRGGNGQWPGETMYAFQQAVNVGVDILEMDVHSTSDGKLVLMHNLTIDETTNGSGCIKKMSWADLQKLDAGYRWTPDGKTFPFRGLGIGVPLLEDVFKAFPDKRMNIEIKQSEPSIVEPFIKMIQEHSMEDRVLVASFDDNVMNDFRKNSKGRIATSASTCELLNFVADNSALDKFKPELRLACKWLESHKWLLSSKELKCNGLTPKATSVPVTLKPDAIQVPGFLPRLKEFVEAAHSPKQSLKIHVWTINEPEQMRKVKEAGADGIITDYPGPLLELLGRTRKLRSGDYIQ